MLENPNLLTYQGQTSQQFPDAEIGIGTDDSIQQSNRSESIVGGLGLCGSGMVRIKVRQPWGLVTN